MPLTAFFDESDRREGVAPICVGGFLFQPSGYKRFRRYWQSHVLRQRGRRFAHFHTTDLCAGRGEYEGLPISDRIELLDHAVHAITANAYGGIGVHFNQAEFIKKAPAYWPQVFGSIYSVACHMCIQTTAHRLRAWESPANVVYVFERGHKWQHEADELMDSIAMSAEARSAFRYRQHIFEPKAEPGLQAADLYSWIITKATVADGKTPKAMKPFIPAIARFVRGQERYLVHSFTGKLLDRFIAEHISGGRLFTYKRKGNRRRAFQ